MQWNNRQRIHPHYPLRSPPLPQDAPQYSSPLRFRVPPLLAPKLFGRVSSASCSGPPFTHSRSFLRCFSSASDSAARSAQDLLVAHARKPPLVIASYSSPPLSLGRHTCFPVPFPTGPSILCSTAIRGSHFKLISFASSGQFSLPLSSGAPAFLSHSPPPRALQQAAIKLTQPILSAASTPQTPPERSLARWHSVSS